jgi:preprotein translocase subunit SecG
MQTVLIVIHLMVVSALIGAVLLQRSEGGGLGVGGGGGFMTSRGTANVLTRTTGILALVFFITSIALSIVAGLDRKPRSILGNEGPQAPASGTPAPGGGGGVLDQLQAPPPGPAQVPRSQ